MSTSKVTKQILLVSLLLLSCQKQSPTVFALAVEKGKINKKYINEASGIDASEVNAGALWTHNDSGGDADAYLLDSLGKYVAKISFDNLKNRDWEEIAVAKHADTSYLYIGEIGDNRSIYSTKYIYKCKEPKLSKDETKRITEFDTIAFALEDGPRDTEAFFVDEKTQDIYIFSKREPEISVYILPYPQATKGILTAKKIATLPITQIVAADYNAQTNELLLKNYETVYYWKKLNEESWQSMFARLPVKQPYIPEPQGEAICFAHSGNGYYTLSEEAKGEKPTLLFYKRN
ncbi:MAG: hypothetical protein O9302_10505 [Cyclobacteriaceae bacterium]|jgi:hypothetical protein|nr:hypothetical protein [Cytophagales bacterium]MCZ8328481.1 hypothetical protein [Cyclobacteriaceae bacterium]